MRVYDVSFRAKPEGSEEYVSVGDEWIVYSTDNSEAIKAVCGSYPSRWDGMRCDKLTPILESGLVRLWEKRGRRFPFATTGYGSVEETIVFLSRVLDGCTRYPHAFVVVRIE